MTIVRIGNNIHVLWKIYNNTGSKYSLSGKVRKLWLSSAALEKEIDTYQIQYRNELVFTIDAGDLTRYGTYKLVLQLSESDSQTEDATYDLTQLFQIVARTYPGACKELDGEVDVQVTSVLNNVVVERIEGLSAYEIAVNEGYVGTESEWIESLNGVGIASIDQTVIAVDDGSYNEVTFTMTNGETYTIRIRNGSKSAGVTRDDIIFALGYTPVTPAELAAKTDIFFATYNSTTWQEINEAVNAGKAVFLKKDEDIYPLVGDGGVTPKLWEFAFVDTSLDHHRAVCHNDDTWQSATRGLATVIDLANKQDVISDLSAIRAGAALGATAYQKPSTGIPASDIASGVIPDISGKQDTLISGSNIKTINGSSILGSGDIQVQTEITMDNVPTSGSNNPVKSGGLYTALAAKQNNLTFDNTPIASSNNPVKSGGLYTVLAEKIGSQDIDNVVELTLAQYNALATKDARTMYIISDSTIASDHVGVASLVQTTTSTEDGGTNVWTCTLTNGQSFTLEVKNGNQGNSGYSGAAGELKVVNNLTDGGATAALSAEMGKQLGNKVRIISDVTASGLSFADSKGNIMVTINDYGLDAARLTTHFKSLLSGQSVVEIKDDEIVRQYGLPLLDTMRSKVIEHNLNNRFLNFAFITDTHTEGTHQIFDLNAVRNMKLFRIWCNEKIVDFGIHCGDIYTDYATSRDEALRLIDSSTQILCDIDCPMFFVKGNHDNNGKGRYEADLSNLDWDNNQYYIAQVTNYGLANAAFSYVRVYEDTWDGESTLYVGGNVKALNITKYQYYQLTQKLSDNEVTRSDTDPYGAYYYKDYSELGVRVVMLNFYDQEAQDQTYGYWEAGGLSTTQMNWLNNVALDTENEVIVFCHWYNADLTSALGTFVNNGGKLIAFIHGHSHEDQYVNTGGFNNIGVRNGFGITTEMTADPNKSFAFSAFTVDTVNKVLYETRLGNGIDRSFSYDTPAQL